MHEFYTFLESPVFLILYAILWLGLLMVCLNVRTIVDGDPVPSRGASKPEVDPNPYRIAYLRGGPHEVLRTATLELYSRGLLQESKPLFGAATWTYSGLPSHEVGLTAFAKEAAKYYTEPRRHTDIFNSQVASMFSREFREWDRWIELEGFRITNEQQSKLNLQVAGAIIVFLSLGAARLLFPWQTVIPNVLVAFMMMIGSLVLLLLKNPRRFSKRGREFLKSTQIVNEQHRTNTRIGSIPSLDSNSESQGNMLQHAPLMAMGIFGVSAMQGNTFGDFRKKYSKSECTGSGW